MRKGIALMIGLIIFFHWSYAPASAAQDYSATIPKIVVDGMVVHFEPIPYFENDKLWVPVKPLAKQLGFNLYYDSVNAETSLKHYGNQLKIVTDHQQIIANGIVYPFASKLNNGSLMVPFDHFLMHIEADKRYSEWTNTYYIRPSIKTKISAVLSSSALSYIGQMIRETPHGSGTYKLHQALWYEGDFLNGKMQGEGKLYDGIRLWYEGEFRNNLPHGQGDYYFPGGSVYTGQFKNGSMNGQGILSYNGHMRYNGHWAGGKMEGRGWLFGPNETLVYEGDFSGNQRNGFGVEYDDSSKIIYEGYWRNGLKHGEGRSYYAGGMLKYEGMWQNDKENGQGAYYTYTINENDDTFRQGEFSDQYDPQQELTMEDLQINEDMRRALVRYGTFKDGKLVNLDEEIVYIGSYVNGKFEKYGWMFRNGPEFTYSVDYKPSYVFEEPEDYLERLEDLLVYVGGFHKGLKHGFGTEYDAEGSIVYQGAYEDGLRNGFGISFISRDTIYAGNWLNGKQHGRGLIYSNHSGDRRYSGFGRADIREVEYRNGTLEREIGTLKFYGQYKNGLMHGQGVTYRIEEDEEKIRENFYFMTRLSSGEMAFKDYEGPFLNGVRDTSEGTVGRLYDNGKIVYEGEFKYGKEHGEGVQYDSEVLRRRVYVGEFKDGYWHGQGEIYGGRYGRLSYIGTLEYGLKHGKGTAYDEDGKTEYSGEFKRGNKDGYGKLYEDGQLRYEGQFKDGEKHGFGVLYTPFTGNIEYEGEFIEGKKAADYYKELEKKAS